MSENITPVKRQRNYGIDLLRIVAIAMVVMLHVLGKENTLHTTQKLSANFNAAWLLEIASYCAVNCYALISGYVGVNSKHKASNIVMLWLQAAFYSVGATLIFRLFVPGSVDNQMLVKSFFPVVTEQYWYFTSYFLLFLFLPFVNFAINKLSRKQLKAVLIGIFVFLFAITTPLFNGTVIFDDGYNMLWLAVMYIFGAYFSKYNVFEKSSKIKLLLIYFVCILVTWVTKLVMVNYNDVLPQFVRNKNFLVSYVSPTIVIAGICLLGIFVNLNIGQKLGKVIVYVASLSFGVYLVHEQPLISRQFIRGNFVAFSDYPTLGMIFALIGTVILVFVICAAIDAVRQFLFKIFKIKNLVCFIENKITDKFKSKEEKNAD